MNEHDNFVQQLMRRTNNFDKPAYEHPGGTLSYRELFSSAGALATSLKDWGIQPGDRVIIALYDTPAFALAMLAAFWIGAVPVPINPKSKRITLQHVLTDSAPKLIFREADNTELFRNLTNTSHDNIRVVVQNLYPCTNTQMFSGDCMDSALSNTRTTEPFYTGPRDADYWQYTSGTTGLAKGVKHRCLGMIHNTELYAKDLLGIDSNSRIYSTAKMFFGYGLGANFFFALWQNATTWLDFRWPKREDIVDNIRYFKPTHFFSVPSIYNLLDLDGECLLEYSIQKPILISASSALPQSVFCAWKNRYDLEIIDGIGSTEMGHIFLSNTPGQCKGGYTGKVVPGYQVKLVSQESKNIGVLHVKGPSVAIGYNKNPPKTQDRFFEDWYNTGDIFEVSSDGFYKYIGRNDDLFKVKGRWIAPLEVEAHLRSVFPHIDDFVFLPKKNLEGVEVPCLFVGGDTSHNDKHSLTRDVISHIKDLYPNYMVPSDLYFMDTLPRNENGRLLRHKLLDLITQKKTPSTSEVTRTISI